MALKQLKQVSRGFFILPLVIILILAALAYGVYYLWQSGVYDTPKVETTSSNQIPFVENKGISTPTPVPFEDLTIPYLRNRSYISSLSGFQKIGENSSYESYITNYDSDGLKIYG